MLNTDFELFFDVELDGDGKAVCILDNTCASKKNCGKDGICPMAETYDQAATYAQVLKTYNSESVKQDNILLKRVN